LLPEARSPFADALGELKVARSLAALGAGWSIFHSVPVGEQGAEVDHLLIGPAGVFTVNTKSVGGHVWVGRTRILVSGRREDYVGKSEREARRVHKRLSAATGSSVFVRPILVFVEPRRLTIRDHPASVTVLADGELLGWLREQTTVYPAGRVRDLVDAADVASTWSGESAGGDETRRQIQRFERLDAEVCEARRRMRTTKLAIWLSSTMVIVASTLALIPTSVTELLAALAR